MARKASVSDYQDEQFLSRTRRFWQRRTKRRLTESDAKDIATNLVGFFQVLREWSLTDEPRITPFRGTEIEE